MKVPLASSGLRPQDIQAAVSVLNSGNLTMGRNVRDFESLMAQYLSVKHFIMVNSGSSANLAIVEGLVRPSSGHAKLKPGDGVLVPAVAWPTTVWPIIQLGLTPVFVDIDIENLSLDLKKAQEIINNSNINIAAIFPIHPLGFPINSDALDNFATSNDLILINDVCESLGSFRNEVHGGTCGLASSFSFYFSHHITTMEGGGVATNDDAFANDLRSIRSHGWSRDRFDKENWHNELSVNDSKFLFVSTGFNIRPMEIQAAIGIQQISSISDFISRRSAIADRVFDHIKDSNFKLIGYSTEERSEKGFQHSWMMLPLLIQGENSKAKRSEVISKLEKMGIETRPVLTGNFLAQPSLVNLGNHFPHPSEFVNATKISESAFMVGAHHDFTSEQIDYLAKSLKQIAAETI